MHVSTCLIVATVIIFLPIHVAKFNGTVPGTLIELLDTDLPNNTTERSDSVNIHVTTTAPIPTAVDSTTETVLEVGSHLFRTYVVVGIIGGVVVLIFGFIIVCVLIGLSIRRKKRSYIITVAATLPTQNGIQTQGT